MLPSWNIHTNTTCTDIHWYRILDSWCTSRVINGTHIIQCVNWMYFEINLMHYGTCITSGKHVFTDLYLCSIMCKCLHHSIKKINSLFNPIIEYSQSFDWCQHEIKHSRSFWVFVHLNVHPPEYKLIRIQNAFLIFLKLPGAYLPLSIF